MEADGFCFVESHPIGAADVDVRAADVRTLPGSLATDDSSHVGLRLNSDGLASPLSHRLAGSQRCRSCASLGVRIAHEDTAVVRDGEADPARRDARAGRVRVAGRHLEGLCEGIAREGHHCEYCEEWNAHFTAPFVTLRIAHTCARWPT